MADEQIEVHEQEEGRTDLQPRGGDRPVNSDSFRRPPAAAPRPAARTTPAPADRPAETDPFAGLGEEELRAELAARDRKLREANRKYQADRNRLVELEEQQKLAEESKLSELDKYKRQLGENDARRAAAEQERDGFRGQLAAERIQRLVEREATGLDFEFPEDACLYLPPESLDADEDGNVSPAKVRDSLKKLLDKRPNLRRSGRGGGSPAAIPGRRAVQAVVAGPAKDPLESLRQDKRYGGLG